MHGHETSASESNIENGIKCVFINNKFEVKSLNFGLFDKNEAINIFIKVFSFARVQ